MFGTSGCSLLDGGPPALDARVDPQPRYLDFGTAASPIVHAGRVYLLDDNEEKSYLGALDAKTGAVIWKTARTAGNSPLSGWSTPYVWVNTKRTEIVAIGRSMAISLASMARSCGGFTGSHKPARRLPKATGCSLSRHRVAGRIESSAVRGEAWRQPGATAERRCARE